jgi:hypothetical protein
MIDILFLTKIFKNKIFIFNKNKKYFLVIYFNKKFSYDFLLKNIRKFSIMNST